jgi:hypothetical protein
MIRAKMTLSEIRTSEWGCQSKKQGESKNFIFTAVYDPNLPGDRRYAECYRANARLEMQVDNPAAIEQLKLGQTFYLDFVPVEDTAKA